MHIICTYELFYNLVLVENDQFYLNFTGKNATSAMSIEGDFFHMANIGLFMRPI